MLLRFFPFPLLSALLFASAAAGQPVIAAVANNYSYIPAGLPNSGIAQGSIFVIFGADLAPSASGIQPLPLKPQVNGVSVQISVGGATTQALLYYVSAGQVAGVLPSSTPLGTGQITVTNNGQTSAPAPIDVVQTTFGIAGQTNSNRSLASAFDLNWKPLSPTNAAHPGDIIEFFGSGAGPVSGNESIQQTPKNLDNFPIEVDVGGVPATVLYHGRSGSPGLDQINIVIPPGAY